MALRSWVVVAAFLLSTPAQGGEETSVKHLVALDYPRLAASARIQGDVVLKCMLNDDGQVKNTEVVSGHPVLAKDARENAAKWTFSPVVGAKGESRVFALIYRFRLEGVCFTKCPSSFSFDYPNQATVVAPAPHLTPSASRE